MKEVIQLRFDLWDEMNDYDRPRTLKEAWKRTNRYWHYWDISKFCKEQKEIRIRYGRGIGQLYVGFQERTCQAAWDYEYEPLCQREKLFNMFSSIHDVLRPKWNVGGKIQMIRRPEVPLYRF